MKQLLDLLIQKERQLLGLNRILLLFAIVSFFFSSYIANYDTTVNEAWIRWKHIIYFDFILIFFLLRIEAKKLLTNTGYKIVMYLLINFFIDEYMGYNTWSWNDKITLIVIAVETVIATLKNRKNERR